MHDSEYRTTVEDKHWREEEWQWARILAAGHPGRGMVLLYLQKACTAFHEFAPAFQAGALDDHRLDFFRQRLANRLKHLLTTMENNNLDTLDGSRGLHEILRRVESAGSMEALCELAETLHAAGHILLDSLERA
jgi:hypothetical protein